MLKVMKIFYNGKETTIKTRDIIQIENNYKLIVDDIIFVFEKGIDKIELTFREEII